MDYKIIFALYSGRFPCRAVHLHIAKPLGFTAKCATATPMVNKPAYGTRKDIRKMKLIVTKSYDESCSAAADIILQLVKNKPTAKFGFATGSTPIPIYQKMAEACKAGTADFTNARTVNLDEYCGIAPDHPQSYRYFMDTNLFNNININKANTFVANGLGDVNANAVELEEKIFEGGVPDLQLLGIGNNGHIGFNETGDQLIAPSHVETLTPSTIEANARFFSSAAEVPTQAITMGMRGIMAAGQLLLVATGAGKAEAIKGLLIDDAVTTQNPATFLKLHPNAVVIIDSELAALAGVK